ncbi:hypothetical protein D3C84_596360 [compost metagenome]
MADVHFLGQVRRGQVDHHGLRLAGLAHAEPAIGQQGIEATGQGVGVLVEVEEAGAGDFDLADLLIAGQRGDQLLGQLARLQTGRFGQHHGDIAGEIAVALVLGVLHLDRRAQALGQHAFGRQAGQGLLDQVANSVFHGLSDRPWALVENCAL